MTKVEMIDDRNRECNSCMEHAEYKITVGYKGSDSSVALCNDCLCELLEQIEEIVY